MRRAWLLAGLLLALAPAAHAAEPGAEAFRQRCGVCHAAGGMGALALGARRGPDKAILQERRDLAADYIRLAARRGIGSMPPINRVEVTDAQLEAIVGYLTGPAGKSRTGG